MKMLLNKKKKKPVLKFNPGFALILAFKQKAHKAIGSTLFGRMQIFCFWVTCVTD